MAKSIPQQVLERTSKPLLAAVFGAQFKVAREAAEAIFSAVVRTGSPLVTAIAGTLRGGGTSRKGRQEQVSGWLERYSFAADVRRHLWDEGSALVGPDTVVAVDSGDLSKEFGGGGMEGMEMGFDASRGVTAMGHALPCAAAVCRRRAVPLRLALLKGRRGLAAKGTELFDEIVRAGGGNGVLVHDRGFDSEEFVSHAHSSGHRAVVRMKVMTRDVFGTGRSVEADMAGAPCANAVLRSPTRRAEAVGAGAPASSPPPPARSCRSSSSPARSAAARCTSTRSTSARPGRRSGSRGTRRSRRPTPTSADGASRCCSRT